MENKTYENFPLSTVIFSNAVNLAIYAIGIYLLAPFGIKIISLYILYIFWMEIRLYRTGCRDCYYYGKSCAFGKGRLCSMIMKQGNPSRFNSRKPGWASLIPDLLVSFIPLALGVFRLIANFSWLLLGLAIAMIILAFPLTGFIRGSLTCRSCRQRELGCPSEKLFSGNK